jgi:hypothetical protein
METVFLGDISMDGLTWDISSNIPIIVIPYIFSPQEDSITICGVMIFIGKNL